MHADQPAPVARAIAFAAAIPTSSAPTSPGPNVTATPSTSANPTSAAASASSSRGFERLDVGAGRDLGDDAAEALVQVHLRRDQVRADA